MVTYSCLTKLMKNEKWDIRGTSLGGLFVLEPWITPSLFYQFLNQNQKNKIALDIYSFCDVLGSKEGNRQLLSHYRHWFNETHIQSLSNKKITHLRIPVGDWMFQPYGPYIGCTNGSKEYLDYVMNLCQKYRIRVLLDLHGVKESQNGLDNSGKSANMEFIVSPSNKERDSTLTFLHWPILSGNWMGTFHFDSKNYSSINYENIRFTKEVLYEIIDIYKDHESLFGIEALNEPWIYTPIPELQAFYYDIYKYMHNYAPHLNFIYHDSFRGYSDLWDHFLINCSNVAMDWHIYQAWNIERYGDQFLLEADHYRDYILQLKEKGHMLIIGEYSLATDNCALWLNGFQDNLEGFPVCDCKYAPCPVPYISVKDLDRIDPIISPFGTGMSSPRMGTCPYEGMLIIDKNQDDFLRSLNLKKLKSFEQSHGWFFWNFQTEIKEEISWNFIESYEHSYFHGSSIDPIHTFERPLWQYGILLVGSLVFMMGLFGLFECYYHYIIRKKENIMKYKYVKIEIPKHEKQPINIYKKNASTGSFPYYQAV